MALGVAGARPIAKAMGTTMLIRPDVIGIAVGFSALVGVGLRPLPGVEGVALDPIDALRFE